MPKIDNEERKWIVANGLKRNLHGLPAFLNHISILPTITAATSRGVPADIHTARTSCSKWDVPIWIATSHRRERTTLPTTGEAHPANPANVHSNIDLPISLYLQGGCYYECLISSVLSAPQCTTFGFTRKLWRHDKSYTERKDVGPLNQLLMCFMAASRYIATRGKLSITERGTIVRVCVGCSVCQK
ncbi:hypothetical protein P153DRAFT_196230 [Dothidotthia symphoricarpi CBS 119687]|uniref:Uncharacterized protein n=1 Tax=Dothidotthia symphoricarpi CBS 119687 TaxID=1392245 RepID=A0A6A6AK44_9PLEO|nr:uncharacterized protein P153DRAFT_196230 [Dothidotthia symphoricarpi CBS 119687]KAF2131478.1 hypothetical protein P153DRAFT_196230 [Dothidotthia symphoricarpi CBS 119687]